MNILSDLTEDHAKKICDQIKKPFLSLHLKKENIIIVFSSETEDSVTTAKEIHIYPNGQVEYYVCWSDSDSEESDEELYPLNSLPITDCLRAEGFEFVY